jgi:leucyl-tRNA synthetase
MDFQKVEQKWQKAWEKAKLGEAKVDKKKEKFFMIFAYPGVSGFLHVGHMKGYAYTDIISRYKRMQNFSVLFPVGVHASGNLAIAFSQKVQKGDKNWIDYLKRNGTTDEELKHLTDPYKVVDFFNKKFVENWKKFGFISDWSRFTATTFPDYNKFIQWQFRKLKQLGLLRTGEYFAPACPVHGPVAVDPSETDISKGGQAEKVGFTILKFKFGDSYLVAATLRPETVFGQTNLWVNPTAEYEKIQVGNETWIASHEFAEKISRQKSNVKVIGKISASELLGKKVRAPGIDREIPILPAEFVSMTFGTGVVTSVPSDAPYDWIALEDLKKNKVLSKKYQLDNVKSIPIIESKGYGEFPAEEICKKLGIKSQTDPALEEATAEIYKVGFHTGVMRKTAGKYAGLPVAEAKEKIGADLTKQSLADVFYDLTEEVVCRCGVKVYIQKISDQWFIRYSDKAWKEKSKEHAKTMNVYPAEYYRNLPGAIDWFQDRACVRLGNWLGTKFPFDEKWTIEPISDSTLYPAYYIVSKFANSKKIKPAEMTEEFFDYVFLGKGKPKKPVWKQIREEFEYFYPLDVNLGGKEHQTVHFPPFVMNHVAILDKKFWPKGIFVNWWITGEGGKISKSKGGAQPIPGAIEKFTVDGLRLYYSHGVSAFEDAEWNDDTAMSYRKQVERLVSTFESLSKFKGTKKSGVDDWLISKLNTKIKLTTEAMDKFDLRKAVDLALFEFLKDVSWYERRGGNNSKTAKTVLETWLKLLAPFAPHVAEELWQKLGKKGFIAEADWPKVDEKKIDAKAEQAEAAMSKLSDDIRNILRIVNKPSIKAIYLYVIPPELERHKQAQEFLAKEFNAKVQVFAVNDKSKYDPENKAGKAKPGKPGIFVE